MSEKKKKDIKEEQNQKIENVNVNGIEIDDDDMDAVNGGIAEVTEKTKLEMPKIKMG